MITPVEVLTVIVFLLIVTEEERLLQLVLLSLTNSQRSNTLLSGKGATGQQNAPTLLIIEKNFNKVRERQ